LVVYPGQFRLALSMTDGPLLDKVSMSMRFTRNGIIEIDHDISLDIVTSGEEISRANFPPNISNGIVLRLPSSRQDDVVTYQRKLQFAREHQQSASASIGIDTRLNQSVLVQACADGNSMLSVEAWILVDNAQGGLPLISDSDLARLINAQAEAICPHLDQIYCGNRCILRCIAPPKPGKESVALVNFHGTQATWSQRWTVR